MPVNLCLLKLIGEKNSSVIVGIIYPPPDSNFNESLSDLEPAVLGKIVKENNLEFFISEWN